MWLIEGIKKAFLQVGNVLVTYHEASNLISPFQGRRAKVDAVAAGPSLLLHHPGFGLGYPAHGCQQPVGCCPKVSANFRVSIGFEKVYTHTYMYIS